jgi:hypothetical protein
MKRSVLVLALAALLLGPAAAEEHEEPGHSPEDIEHGLEMRRAEMEMHRAEMELEAEEAELDFRRRMHELELQERGRGLKRRGCPLSKCGPARCRCCAAAVAVLCCVCLVVHVLTAVWVGLDIRDRKQGSGLWVVITALTGICGALVYAIVRLGDQKKTS